jgi:hypothetical protein
MVTPEELDKVHTEQEIKALGSSLKNLWPMPGKPGIRIIAHHTILYPLSTISSVRLMGGKGW